MNKNVNIYDNHTRGEIKRKMNLLDYNTDCIVQLNEIQLNENKAILKLKIIYMNIKEKKELPKLQIIAKCCKENCNKSCFYFFVVCYFYITNEFHNLSII